MPVYYRTEDVILRVNCSLSFLLVLLWESKTTNEVATIISSNIFHNITINDDTVTLPLIEYLAKSVYFFCLGKRSFRNRSQYFALL